MVLQMELNVLSADNHMPTRLVDLCITYLAKHLNHVESFVDFPDQIGEQIFSEAVSLRMFEEKSQTEVNNMRLFCEAYGTQVLSSLNLSRHHLVVNNYSETICTFRSLTGLDLTACGLGDDHPVIAAVANFNSLLVLGLQDNALSDEGIRRMTSPIRMFKKGPLNLHKIDISDNPKITVKGVLYLKVFTQLQLIHLSRTSVKPSETATFEDRMKMVQLTQKASDVPILQVQTTGWAATVIETWIQDCQTKQKLNASKPKRSNFYGRMSRSFSQDMNLDNPSAQTGTKMPILILVRQSGAYCNKHKINTSTFKNSRTVQRDGKHVEAVHVVPSKHSSKKRKLSDLKQTSDSNDEDKLLMELYSGLENKKQCCFADLC